MGVSVGRRAHIEDENSQNRIHNNRDYIGRKCP
jgi:hypothetical protein